jgi:hypothetical protein
MARISPKTEEELLDKFENFLTDEFAAGVVHVNSDLALDIAADDSKSFRGSAPPVEEDPSLREAYSNAVANYFRKLRAMSPEDLRRALHLG